MTIGVRFIELVLGLLVGCLILFVCTVALIYFFRLLWTAIIYVAFDQAMWVQGQFKKFWRWQPIHRHRQPREPYFPAEVEEEVERRVKHRLRQTLGESRKRDRPPNQDEDE